MLCIYQHWRLRAFVDQMHPVYDMVTENEPNRGGYQHASPCYNATIAIVTLLPGPNRVLAAELDASILLRCCCINVRVPPLQSGTTPRWAADVTHAPLSS